MNRADLDARLAENYIPVKFDEPLLRAAESGSFKLLNVVLDRILAETTLTRIDIANAQPFGDQTIMEKVAEFGHVELFHSLLEYGYATTDKERRKAARELLLVNSTLQTEDRTSASELQLLATMEAVMTLKDKHTLATEYYHVRHFYLMFLPSTVMSAAAATIAFLSVSPMLEDHAALLVIVVGVLSSLSALLQSISDQVQLNAKALQHKSAAHELDGLLQILTFHAIGSLNQPGGASSFFSDAELKTMKKQVTSIEQTCQSVLPAKIDCLYDQLKNDYQGLRVQASRKALFEDGGLDVMEENLNDVVTITQEITCYRFWPWFIDTDKITRNIATRLRSKFIQMIGARAQPPHYFLFDIEKGVKSVVQATIRTTLTVSHPRRPFSLPLPRARAATTESSSTCQMSL
jgi:hypothetical protein